MKKDNQTKQRLIYIRYILPPVLITFAALMGFIRSYAYTESGMAREPISLIALLSNSWKQGRILLFATPEVTVGELAFARLLITLVIVTAVLYLVALAVSVWSCYVALKLFMSDDEESAERSRTLFITFIPNRILLTAVQSLSLAVLVFPYLMPMLYSYTLGAKVGIALVAPDGLIFGVISLIAVAILSALTAPYERRFDADVFKKSRNSLVNSEESDGGYESLLGENGEEDESYLRLREEQAERIRTMLKNSDRND